MHIDQEKVTSEEIEEWHKLAGERCSYHASDDGIDFWAIELRDFEPSAAYDLHNYDRELAKTQERVVELAELLCRGFADVEGCNRYGKQWLLILSVEGENEGYISGEDIRSLSGAMVAWVNSDDEGVYQGMTEATLRFFNEHAGRRLPGLRSFMRRLEIV